MSGYASYMVPNFRRMIIPLITNRDSIAHILSGYAKLSNERTSIQTKDVPLKDGNYMVADKTTRGGNFSTFWNNNRSHAINNAIESEEYTTGLRERNYIFTREMNYHPDSSQNFIPSCNTPYYMILGLPNSKPEEVLAIKLRGIGIHINPGVWHQPPIPEYGSSLDFYTEQLRSHNCVIYDFFDQKSSFIGFRDESLSKESSERLYVKI